MPEILSQTAFAARIGVTQQAVSKAIATGRLNGPAVAGRRIVLPFAEAQWRGNASPAAQLAAGVDPLPPLAADAPAAEAEPQVYRDAKAREAVAAARLRELQLEEKEGKLKPVEAIGEALAQVAGELVAGIETLVSRAEEITAAARDGDVPAVRAKLRAIVAELRTQTADRLEALADA